MVDAKQQETQSFILVPAGGPYVQQWRAQGLYYLAPGVLVVGLLQARRERKPVFQVPGVVVEGVVGELESKCVAQPVSCCVVSMFPPWQGGFVPLL
jgi:hypothetical protein